MPASEQTWWINPTRLPNAALRLFCLPCAGGGPSMYRPWSRILDPRVELWIAALPGRERRLSEPSLTSVEAIIAELYPRMLPLLDRPFALFGHSMGTLVAYELAAALARDARPPPEVVFVVSRDSPADAHAWLPPRECSDDEFVERIAQRYGGIPEVVRDVPDMLDVILPPLRADFAALLDYPIGPKPALDAAIRIASGRTDPGTTPIGLARWAEFSRRRCELTMFDGGHFFFRDAEPRARLLAWIEGALLPPLER